jgi:hypothetical protein
VSFRLFNTVKQRIKMKKIILLFLLAVPLTHADIIRTKACDRGNCCNLTINDRDDSYSLNCDRRNTEVILSVSDRRGRHEFNQVLRSDRGRLDRRISRQHSFRMDIREVRGRHETVVVKEGPRRHETIVVKDNSRPRRRSGPARIHYEEPDCYDIGSGRFRIEYESGEVLVEGRCHRRDRDGEFLFYNDFGDLWMRVNYHRDRAERIECRDRRGHWRNVRSEDDCFRDYDVRTIRRARRR